MTVEYELIQPMIVRDMVVGPIEVGDWVEITAEGRSYGYTLPGALGTVTATTHPSSTIARWDVDTLTNIASDDDRTYAEYSVDVHHLRRITPEPWRVARRAETEAATRRAFDAATALQTAQALERRRVEYHTATAANLNIRNWSGVVHNASRYSRRRSEPRNESLGARVAAAIHAQDTSSSGTEVSVDLLNELRTTSGTIAAALVRDRLDDDEICQCADCEVFVSIDEMREVDSGSDDVCESCISSHYRWSECMDAYIHDDDSEDVYEDADSFHQGHQDDVCTRAWGRNNLRIWSGSFVTDEAYDELDNEDDDDDDDDEDEDEPRNDGLNGYHNSYRNFVEVNETPKIPALGVELEVYCEERGDVVTALKDALPDDWLYERDGSLSERYGFEIISQPYGPNEWAEHADTLLTTLADNTAKGYSTPAGSGYGIHINVHRRHLSGLQEARMLMFLLTTSNRDFVTAIAQRSKMYGGDAHQIGQYTKPSISKLGGITTGSKKPRGLGKYSPLNMNGDIAEFRLFQSTLHRPSYMKNLEFVWALIEWTSTTAATGTATDHTQFVKWLGATSERVQRYPNLVAYIRKPSFMGIGFESSIKNTWKHLLPVTTTKSHDVVSGDADLRLAA